MSWDTCIAFTNASLRASDFHHFKAMKSGSAKLHKAILHARGLNVPSTKALAIRWMPPKSDKPLALDDVRRAVARYFNVSPVDLRAGIRKATLVRARSVAMTVMHRRGNSYAAIARWFGFADHTTVRHHILKLAVLATDEELDLIERLSPEVCDDGNA